MSDQLKKIDEKMAQLKAQKQAILSREKAKERKERTRRLIQIGAIMEKYLKLDSVEKAEAFGQYMTSDVARFNAYERNFLEKVKPEE